MSGEAELYEARFRALAGRREIAVAGRAQWPPRGEWLLVIAAWCLVPLVIAGWAAALTLSAWEKAWQAARRRQDRGGR